MIHSILPMGKYWIGKNLWLYDYLIWTWLIQQGGESLLPGLYLSFKKLLPSGRLPSGLFVCFLWTALERLIALQLSITPPHIFMPLINLGLVPRKSFGSCPAFATGWFLGIPKIRYSLICLLLFDTMHWVVLGMFGTDGRTVWSASACDSIIILQVAANLLVKHSIPPSRFLLSKGNWLCFLASWQHIFLEFSRTVAAFVLLCSKLLCLETRGSQTFHF